MFENEKDDTKTAFSNENALCRCCLSAEKQLKHISLVSMYYEDISGIQVCSDGIPPWICAECVYLLEKSVKFKLKIVKAHQLLNDYLTRCAPFPIDAQDSELKKYATSQLSETQVLLMDNTTYAEVLGFHIPVEHTKTVTSTPLQVNLCASLKQEVVKQEDDGISDFEDDIPLEEFRRNSEITLEEFKDLLEESEKVVVKPKKRKKRIVVKKKKKKRLVTEKEPIETKQTVRTPLEVDPTKIISIKLNLAEQIELRKKLSTDERYLKFAYKCELCYKGFNHELKLDNHMKKHSPARGKFKCKLCKMHLPTLYSYRVHELTHSTRYECVKCGRTMVDRLSMIRHYQSEHEGQVPQYTCTLCGKVSHNDKTHRGHMRNHHSGHRPKCDQCGKTFVNNDSLNDHMLIHKGVKNYKCDTCGVRFRTKNQVQHHQIKHSSRKDFYCVECDARFKSESNLRQHLLRSAKHVDRARLKYPCPRCPRRLASARNLQHHLAYQHDGLRLYSCAHCSRAMATANSLAKHVRTAHLGVKAPLRHVCDACGKAFTSKNVLTNHVRTHTGEKPFECEYCGRKFSQRSAKNTHIKLVHLKIKRNSKVKEVEDLSANKIIPKEENPGVFENWRAPHDEIFFTVTAGP